MKVPLLTWEHPAYPERYLLRVPYYPLVEFAAKLDELEPRPMGLVPHHDFRDLAYSARCAATARDFFPRFAIYVPIPPDAPREFLRAVRAAGFEHFVLPWSEPWYHYLQFIHDLIKGKGIHVAGGDPHNPEWSWSEEEL